MTAYQTEIHASHETISKEFPQYSCAFHHVDGHTLNNCHTFQRKPITIRRKFLREKNICFKCCLDSTHQARDCKKKVQCDRCKGEHATAVHVKVVPNATSNGGERQPQDGKKKVENVCTHVCGNRDDDKKGMSPEDLEFLDIMDKGFIKSADGHWSAPLPFRNPRPRLPNNRDQALKRAQSLKRSLDKNHEKKEHFVEFMSRIFKNGYAEIAPPLAPDEECWYLPIFGVYHAKKPGQIRVVFDSSAQYRGLSLNSALLQGPDLMNSLLGVLMRFRIDPVAVMADVQHMFFQFQVHEKHRNFLRFIWFRDNNPHEDLVEYRMCSHVFGNSPSPAIASYGLKKTAAEMEPVFGSDVRDFVEKDFYVDDGLSSFPDANTAVDVVRRTQKALSDGGNLRLHKIASNSQEVMRAFPKEDLAKDLQDVTIGSEVLPTQRSLGMSWNLNTDCSFFTVSNEEKPLTRRGVLSVVNSLYDPLGFVAPILIQGKLLLRDLTKENADWDEPLPDAKVKKWFDWRNSLQSLEQLNIRRTYLPASPPVKEQEIHIFCDASEQAVSAVAYMKSVDKSNESHIGFILGKSKVAPQSGHTIPRLELCSTVLAVEIAEIISEHLDIPIEQMKFYTDSRVVLGYLYNKTRRFFIYVQNRVARVLKSTAREQWSYVPTDDNPADQGTRPVPAAELQESKWLYGPEFLQSSGPPAQEDTYELQSPEEDKEIRVEVFKTSITQNLVERFQRFSDWNRLLAAIGLLKAACRRKKTSDSSAPMSKVDLRKEAENEIIRQEQRKAFPEELQCLIDKKDVPKTSSIAALRPYLDKEGVLRVGGRLNRSGLPVEETNPVILPKKSHTATLLVRYLHEQSKHQGRIITEVAIRNRGYWVVGARRLISTVLHSCVKCRKLRALMAEQLMADLPEDRLEPGPPFTSVGIDTFGPYSVVTRRTRGGAASSKRWGILFTCMTTRAVHIEVVEELSSSSFINALRRFIAVRGNVRQFRSDRGTNFVGAIDGLQINAVNVEDEPVAKFLYTSGIKWLFNSPHSSHMGGVWERMIGLTRRILDAILLDHPAKNLTHEVLVTFMAEACAIINSRPVAEISTDPEDPVILSPATLLNQKVTSESIPYQDLSIKDLYRAHWKQVQLLSDMFWKRWREGYLQSLQTRQKWFTDQPNVKNGDVILLKDKDAPRCDWCLGIVINAIASKSDGKVRKAEVRVCKKTGKCATYTRPVTEMVILLND